jgi:heme/copper-type cytochrome/quinol oxidase subunit 2
MPARPRRRALELATVLAATAALATGCGGTAGEPAVVSTGPTESEQAVADEEATTPAEPTPPAEEVDDGATVVDVTVSGGSVSTPQSRVDVEVGAPVRLLVTSDTDDELHVHGVDIEQPLVAGQPTVLDFVPPEPGVYDVETHDSHLLLVQVAAR